MKHLLAVLFLLMSINLVEAACVVNYKKIPRTTTNEETLARHRQQENYIQSRLKERSYSVITIGDSIMGMWPNELLESMWGGPLLKAARGGSTTLDWLKWLDEWDWGSNNPDIVHINIGRNDIGNGGCPQEVARSILELLTKIKTKWPGVSIMWQNITPGGEYLRLKDFEIRETNRLVLAQVKSINDLQILDAWSIIYNWCNGYRRCGAFYPGDDYPDGPIHLGLNAYEQIYKNGKVIP